MQEKIESLVQEYRSTGASFEQVIMYRLMLKHELMVEFK